MKIREYIVVPLLAIAVGVFASLASLLASGMKLNHLLDVYDTESGSPGLLVIAIFSLFFWGLPGIISDFCFRKYPERVRLSPFSFGLIPAIPLSLIPDIPAFLPFIAGNAVMAVTCLCACTFKPGKRLGEFERISFRKTVVPFLLTGFPCWCVIGLIILIARKAAY